MSDFSSPKLLWQSRRRRKPVVGRPRTRKASSASWLLAVQLPRLAQRRCRRTGDLKWFSFSSLLSIFIIVLKMMIIIVITFIIELHEHQPIYLIVIVIIVVIIVIIVVLVVVNLGPAHLQS